MATIKSIAGGAHDKRGKYGTEGVSGSGSNTYGVGGVTGGSKKCTIKSVAGGAHDKRMGYGVNGAGKKVMALYAVDGREDLPRVQRRRNHLRDVCTTAPTFASAVVENAAPTDLVITCSENVAIDTDAGFTVYIDGAAVATADAPTVSTTDITLVLATAVVNGDVVTYDYDTDSGRANVTSVDDTALMASSLANAVTNNVV